MKGQKMATSITKTALRSATCLTVFVSLASISAQAQETDAASAPAAASEDADVIVVTGSRISRPDLEAAVPISVVSAAKISQTGTTNIQDTLAQLPSVGQNISRTSSNFSNTGTGVATINLRNLGSSRTLVLIDGRRSLGIAGSSAVDVNNIPTELIDRVEVVTGGASAVYGSEAIAGVVNFVLKDKFEGLSIHAQNTMSDEGDATRQYASLTAGKAFADDRGHLVANVTYDNDDGLRSRKRGFSAHDVPNRSSYASQGVFDVRPQASATFAGGNPNVFTFSPSNVLKNYQSANIDGYDRNQDRYLSVPVKRYLGTVLGSFEFSPAATLYAQGQYVKTKSNASLEPSAISNTGPGAALAYDGSAYAGIPITSPFVPDAIRAAAIAAGSDVIQFRRRSNDIFSRSNKVDRDFYRGVIGLKGEVGGGFNYDVYYEHSESRDHTTTGAIYAPNYGAALDNELVGGTIRCSDPAARAAGCVPMNIFGRNTVSPEAAAFLQTYTGPTQTVQLSDGPATFTNGQSVDYDYLAKVKQDVVNLSVSGELFSLWGGPVSIAAGGEYRREKSSEVFDPFTRAGLSSGNQISNTVGKFNVKEVYGEIVAPIVEGRPFLHYLGVEGAVRYADYSTVGGVTSWKFGGTFAPIPDVRFRAVYARATRAPNIGELFAASSQTFPAVTDPCDQAGGEGDGAPITVGAGALPAACLANPAIAAAARGSGFTYSTSQIQTIDGLLGGNRDLKAEVANTLTVGAVITPQFVPGFSLTVDYYHIKVKDAIGIIGQQVSVEQCLQTGDPLFCNNVVRASDGHITRVNALNLNTGSYLVAGLDVDARYTKVVPIGNNDWTFDADVAWNHRFKQEQTPFPGGPVQQELGQADCYSCGRLGSGFKDRIYGTFTVSPGAFSLNYRVNYMSPLYDNLEDPDRTRIKAYWYHNVQGRFAVGEKKDFEFYVGVNNLFDKKPPQFGDTNTVTWPGTQTVADTYDLYGRMFYAGFTANF